MSKTNVIQFRAIQNFISECREFDIKIPTTILNMLASPRIKYVKISELGDKVLPAIQDILIEYKMAEFPNGSLLESLNGKGIVKWNTNQSLLCFIFLDLLPMRGLYEIISASEYNLLCDRFLISSTLNPPKYQSLTTSRNRGYSEKYNYTIDAISQVIKEASKNEINIG